MILKKKNQRKTLSKKLDDALERIEILEEKIEKLEKRTNSLNSEISFYSPGGGIRYGTPM